MMIFDNVLFYQQLMYSDVMLSLSKHLQSSFLFLYTENKHKE